jgi:uncharacterized membrane protein
MSYDTLMFLHLYTIIPCVFIGGLLLTIKKGTLIHKRLGRIYMILMLFTAIVTLFMPSAIGVSLFNHFGWIHLFSVLTLWTVPTAYIAIKKGDIKSHKQKMVLLYFGAIVIAGVFTLTPGRYLHELFFM